MRTLTIRTNKEKLQIQTPQRLDELSCEQFETLIEKWDFKDWVDAFSIISGLSIKEVNDSKDEALASALYETIAFLFDQKQWDALEALPIPKEITLRPIWAKDADLIPPSVTIPRKVGRLSIEQTIQARKHLEGVKDLREGLSMVTAIYLQPLLDGKPSNEPLNLWQRVKMFFGAKDPRTLIPAPFDMLEVMKYEFLISKMYVGKVFPIGFFLLRRLNESGKKHLKG